MIKGLPEDGDVRNTVLFRSIAPYIHSISTNQLIFELLKVCEIKGWAGGSLAVNHGCDSDDLNMAFSWAGTEQGHGFWSKLNIEHKGNKHANR